MRSWFVAAIAVLVTTAALPSAVIAQDSPVESYRDRDQAQVARNILPPGQGTHVNHAEHLEYQGTGEQPPHNTDQLDLYDDLVQAAPDLSGADLEALFKDASFGVPEDEVEDEYSPRDGVVVQRDGFGVPHVYGSTREDTMFGVGYVSAEDRLFMMDVLRHLGRGRLSEFLGASEANLAMDRAQRRGADYTDEELEEMIGRAYDLDPELGALAEQDFAGYVDGINTYISEALVDRSKLPAIYDAVQQVPQPWTAADSVAVASLIGATFSPGGGGQLDNAAFLQALDEAGHSPADARAILDDFRLANDPEAPTTIDEPFPFLTDLGDPDPDANVLPDDAAAAVEAMGATALPEFVDTPFGPLRIGDARTSSNALLVGSELSDTGQALAVFGPQVGYFSPQILMEIDMHGPGLHARGAAFPGISLYVLLGRGTNYAWSATTANGDHRDIRAVELCEPDGSEPTLDSVHYLDDGDCVEMYTRTDQWLAKPSAGGFPPEMSDDAVVVSMTTERTRHGIVQARAEADGTPHAFVLQRSSYRREVDATLTYTAIHDPDRIGSIDDLRSAFVDYFSYSFNWFLAHGDDIGFQMTGHYPLLPRGVDPDLPLSGDSRWDPTGLLAKDDIPHVVNPEKGFITNWNGKQAPGFRSADQLHVFGPTQRAMHLTDGVVRAQRDDGKVDLTELTQAMAVGATQDLYGDKVLPLMLDAVGAPDDARLEQATTLLRDWADDGAHRRDLDEDGEYDDEAAIALSDAWWPLALEAAFGPVLGDAFDAFPEALTTPANPGGSAYFGGWHGQLHKDLRQVLGRPVAGAFSRSYCGEGDLDACRGALRASLDEAVTALEAEFGDDPGDWDVDESAEQIQFESLDLVDQRPMQWQNRPTFQQVLAFGAPDEPEPAPGHTLTPAPAPETDDSDLPTTGAAAGVLGFLLLAAARGLASRRRR